MNERDSHFNTTPGGTATSPGRYVQIGEIGSVQFVPGLSFRPVLGAGSLVNFVSFEHNTEAPMHVHEEEQFTIVLEGEFEFELDGDIRVMRPGDMAVIPPWVPHGARTRDTTCEEIDVFTPPRTTLIEHARSGQPLPPSEAGV